MKVRMLLLAVLSFAAMAVQGENVLFNGKLTQLKGKKAAAWSNVGKINITFSSKDGVKPEIGAVKFTAGTDKVTGSIRQNVVKKVVKGKKYLLSANFCGKGFKAADYGFMLINKNWKGSAGFRRFKLPEGKWALRSKKVTVPENWTDVTAVVFVADMQGELMVSDIKCEPAE